MLSTTTIGSDEDNPSFSLCPGHVTPEEFAKAFEAEGWSETDAEDWELKHEWWIQNGDGSYHASTQGSVGAQPFTVGYW